MATHAEAGALQQSLMHRLTILKNLWHAEPVGLASLGDCIADIAGEMTFDEMRGKLRKMKMFTRVRKVTTLTEHDAGVQVTPLVPVSHSEMGRLRLTPTRDWTKTLWRGQKR